MVDQSFRRAVNAIFIDLLVIGAGTVKPQDGED
jgi:hypothetical protein